MNKDLLRSCLLYHGPSLFNTLKCEQTENPDFQALLTDLDKALHESEFGEPINPLVEQFIARKADILFNPAWKTAKVKEEDTEPEEEAAEPYAIMPPLELFMEVPHEERQSMLYRDLEKGDIVVGKISNIRDYGFFLKLICMAGGLKRDIEDLELSALCHVSEISSKHKHEDILSYYQIGDLVRVGVKDIDRFEEKITVSLRQESLSPNWKHIKLGVITREELPSQYSRSVSAASNATETYECILGVCHGYHNPSVVDYLLDKLGVSDTQPPSMMRGLQSKLFQEEDFAAAIRKKQSTSWALKCVRAGVDHFKHGRPVEAMNEYNKALEIDKNNVEALVARGALYANKGSIVKAITDFELALDNCPDHRNAKKYLCQTLVERGKQLEGQEKLVTAEGLYRRALSLDDSNLEAKEALHKITDTIQKSIRLREEALAKEQVKAKSGETSAEKLRKILKEEKRMKRKRKQSTSSSSSSSTSSSSSSSSPHSQSSRRRSKKKKKKERRSERSSKRHGRLSSRESWKSEDGKSEKCRKEREDDDNDDEVEWFPAPPNTSATFLNQRGGPMFGVMDEELEDEKCEKNRKCQPYSLSAASEDEDSESSHRENLRSDRKEGQTKKSSLGLSPESLSWNKDGGNSSKERKWEVERRERKDSDSKRSVIDEKQMLSVSEQSWKSYFIGSASKPPENRSRPDVSVRNKFEGSWYQNNVREDCQAGGQVTPNKPTIDRRAVEHCSTSTTGKQPESAGNHNETSNTRSKKEVPANLLDIFNQIAQFEKQKVGKAKK